MATETDARPVGRSKGEDTKDRILDAAQDLVLARGYSGTSVDDILAATGLTKGAFFYHFKSKGDLARLLVERFWRRDKKVLLRLWQEAEQQSEDPYERVVIWFKLFEALFEQPDEVPVACLFASYLYEREQFEPTIIEFIHDSFREWSQLYAERFAKVLESRRPKVPISAHELSEIAISLIQGGFVLRQSYRDPDAVPRQSRHFRQYLELVFAP